MIYIDIIGNTFYGFIFIYESNQCFTTLKGETFAGRNFCGFAVFGRIRKSEFPQKVRKVVNRKSLFPQKVWNLSTTKKKFIPAKKSIFS